jgi:hypothetical protein
LTYGFGLKTKDFCLTYSELFREANANEDMKKLVAAFHSEIHDFQVSRQGCAACLR